MRTLLTILIAVILITSGCAMVTKEKPNKDSFSLKQYQQEKEQMLKQGKQQELKQDLQSLEVYLNGTLNLEIESTQEEMARTYQQINILRKILKLPSRPLDKGI